MDNSNNNHNSFDAFEAFLQLIEEKVVTAPPSSLPLKATSLGTVTIQQTLRNNLRREAEQALFEGLKAFLEAIDPSLQVYQTSSGIVLGWENLDSLEGGSFYWELSSTIKATNYDVQEAQETFLATTEARTQRKEQRAASTRLANEALAAKRAAKEAAAARLIKRSGIRPVRGIAPRIDEKADAS